MSDPLGLLDIARGLLQSRLQAAWTATCATLYALGVVLPLVDDLARSAGPALFPVPLTTPLSTVAQIAQWLGLPTTSIESATIWIAARADIIELAAVLGFVIALIVCALSERAIAGGPTVGTFALSAATLVQIGWSSWGILGSLVLAAVIAGLLPGEREDRLGNVVVLAGMLPLMPVFFVARILFIPGPARPRGGPV